MEQNPDSVQGGPALAEPARPGGDQLGLALLRGSPVRVAGVAELCAVLDEGSTHLTLDPRGRRRPF